MSSDDYECYSYNGGEPYANSGSLHIGQYAHTNEYSQLEGSMLFTKYNIQDVQPESSCGASWTLNLYDYNDGSLIASVGSAVMAFGRAGTVSNNSFWIQVEVDFTGWDIPLIIKECGFQ